MNYLGTLVEAEQYLGVIMLFIFLSSIIPSSLRFISKKYNIVFIFSSYFNSVFLPSTTTEYLLISSKKSSKKLLRIQSQEENNNNKSNKSNPSNKSNKEENGNKIQAITSHPSDIHLNTSQKYFTKENQNQNKNEFLLMDLEDIETAENEKKD